MTLYNIQIKVVSLLELFYQSNYNLDTSVLFKNFGQGMKGKTTKGKEQKN